MATIELAVDQIKVEGRHRNHLGDIDALVGSIERVGLLQPIGVDQDYRLIFGERRVRAFQKLGRETIPAQIIDVDALLAEHDENVIRKEFTASERVAIASALKERHKIRHGGDRKSADQDQKIGLDQVVKQAGFGNPETYRQARKAVEQGSEALVTAMDDGEISIAAAAEIATLPKEDQAKAIATGEAQAITAAKDIKRKRRAKRQATRAENAKAQAAKNPVLNGASFRLLIGKFADVAGDIPEGSIHTIITDPPYEKKYLPDYEALSEFASRKLVAGGLCLVMTGQAFLREVLENLSRHLRYQWLLAYVTPGQSTQVWGRKIKSNWKPIILLSKGAPDWEHSKDVFSSDQNDKRFHAWGQSVGGMAQLIEHYTTADQVICDPFCGAGTTGVAALSLGRRFIGVDMEKAHIVTASERLAKANRDRAA